ncbi:hypothetical protein [Rhizocola hellebori]|uniref:hypothetical protein n=1 Tax=Rhizocola hellebori TaxID=1392758 RepID=UPI001942DDDA|nr:hypothetical protein [Rhizocola hellebori]
MTEKSLSFRAHALNVQSEPLDIPVRDIVGMRKFRTLGIFANGLAVTTISGDEHRLTIGKRGAFLEAITRLNA